MSNTLLYPLRFEPIYQHRLWGGRRLVSLLTAPLPGDGPIGEAWVLRDRDDHRSLIADGPLKGRAVSQMLAQFPEEVMGNPGGRFRRFPLLLKFLDARERLSAQVCPPDTHADLPPAGETAKTEACVGTGGEAREPHLCGPGASGVPGVLVCIEGTGQAEHGGAAYAVGICEVFLLPAVSGPCSLRPCSTVSVLESEMPG